jgi:hypothetical protein
MRAKEILLETAGEATYSWADIKTTLETLGLKSRKIFQLMQALPEHVEEYSWNTILRGLSAVGLNYTTVEKIMSALRRGVMSQIEEQPQPISPPRGKVCLDPRFRGM